MLGITAKAVLDFLGSGGLSRPLEIVSSVPVTSAPWAGDQLVACSAIALDSGQVTLNCFEAVVMPYG